jgi:hypothetical protein
MMEVWPQSSVKGWLKKTGTKKGPARERVYKYQREREIIKGGKGQETA